MLELLLVAAGLAGGVRKAAWQNPLPLGNDLHDAFFVDTLTGWCVGSTGAVVKTSDGGATWSIQESKTEEILLAVNFIDSLHGWASGNGVILGTTDGGDHWTVQKNDLDAIIRSVFFLDCLHGWGCGDSIVIRTSDGGHSWTRSVVDSAFNLRSIVFHSRVKGWLVGENRIFTTTDGGLTWIHFPSPMADVRFSRIAFANDRIGWLVGVRVLPSVPIGISLAGYVWKTTDAGQTWGTVHADTVSYFCEVCYINFYPDIVFADSLYGYLASMAAFYSTTDGGIHWDSVGLGIRVNERYALPGRGALYNVGFQSQIMKSSDLGNSWRQLSQGTLFSITKVQFFDTLRGCAVASGGGEAKSNYLLTTDRGMNWNLISASFDDKGAATGSYFVDSLRGWVCTDWFHTVGNTGYTSGLIFGTTNGGHSWTQEVSDTSYNRLFGIHFCDARNGVAVGSGNILRTTDGGNTWSLQFSGFGGTPEFYAAFLQDSLTGWAGGLDRLYFTTDAGHTWQVRDTLDDMPSYSIKSLIFSSRNIGWIAGYDWISQSGFVGRSTDAGLTWRKVLAGYSGDYKGLQFADDLQGWAVGNAGIVASTVDGGVNWDVKALPHIGRNLQSVFLIDKNNGWVAGEGGAILRLWTDSATTGVKLQPPSVPPAFTLYQNYPNPFNPIAQIRYSIPYKEHVLLKIFNVLGQDVATLMDEVQEPGEKSIEFHAGNLPSGVYYYNLAVPKHFETKKMILCK